MSEIRKSGSKNEVGNFDRLGLDCEADMERLEMGRFWIDRVWGCSLGNLRC